MLIYTWFNAVWTYDWAYWRVIVAYYPVIAYFIAFFGPLLIVFYFSMSILYTFVSSLLPTAFWDFQLSLYYLFQYLFGLEAVTAHNQTLGNFHFLALAVWFTVFYLVDIQTIDTLLIPNILIGIIDVVWLS